MMVEVGAVYTTPGAQEALDAAEQTVDEFILRHANGDWGELGTATWRDQELREGFRVFSAYTLSTGVKLCMFTEDDRSVTAVYLPEETLHVCSPTSRNLVSGRMRTW